MKDPNGMKGIGVVWQAIEDPQFKLNYFFSVDTEKPDVDEAIEEAKKSVNAMLRRVDKPITNSTVPLRSIPSDIASMAGFSATV
jgi:signal transduction protein with GAF and PtsI domain